MLLPGLEIPHDDADIVARVITRIGQMLDIGHGRRLEGRLDDDAHVMAIEVAGVNAEASAGVAHLEISAGLPRRLGGHVVLTRLSHDRGMAKPPRRVAPRTRKTDVVADRATSREIVTKPADPRQVGLFDTPLPKWIKPCLPTLVDKPPAGPQWVHEIKWDGYRVSAYLNDGKATIRTRGGYDWTARFPMIAAALLGLKVRSAVIDGEAVILDDQGRSSFAELQADLDRRGSDRAVLYAFDLLFLDGEDLRGKTLEERRDALRGIIPKRSAILLSKEYEGAGADLFRTACEHDLEGIVSKRLDRPYRSGRSKDWQKTKCVQSETFVIIGYQPGTGAVRTPIANIKVARFDGQRLAYAGAVGTGFSEKVGKALRARLDGLRSPRCAVHGLKVMGAVWVVPDLEAEIAYRGVTTAGELRHASFKGLVE